jgi:hypothetical protein
LLALIESERVHLVPVRSRYLALGSVGFLTYAVGFLVALPFARKVVLTLVLFGILTILGAAVSFAGYRKALKTVVVPPPPGAIIGPARFPTSSVLTIVGIAGAIVLASVVGTVGASVLGFGFGSSVPILWAARKVTQFERRDGRRILRTVGTRFRGEPGLYAGPVID